MTAIPASAKAKGESLVFPFPAVPGPGESVEIAPGILWVRMPLPFRLDHVNLYLIEDGDGFAVLDAGIGDDMTREVWEALMAGPLAGSTGLTPMRFFVANLLGAAVYVPIAVGAGYAVGYGLGDQIDRLRHALGEAEHVLVIALLLAAALVWIWVSRRARGRPGP